MNRTFFRSPSGIWMVRNDDGTFMAMCSSDEDAKLIVESTNKLEEAKALLKKLTKLVEMDCADVPDVINPVLDSIYAAFPEFE